VLVAGGRGIAPLIFLSTKASASGRVVFLAGARTEIELRLLDRIKATEIFLSTDDGSLGRKGTVVELLKSLERSIGWLRRRNEASPGVVVYGCGPAGMLHGLHSYVISKRAPCYVSLEAHMACGMGVCQGCAVKAAGPRFSLVCKDGPVFDSRLIDWKQYEGAWGRAR
jgi:dihydroorotate dehydrogenase electron transfer subunit